MYGFYNLIFINCIRSTQMALSYLLFSQSNGGLLIFWFCISFMFFIVNIFSLNFGFQVLEFLCTPKLINYSLKKMKKIKTFFEKYPFLFLLLVHSYISLCFLHFLSLWLGNLNPFLESFYQCLVLLRNYYVLPVFIYNYRNKHLLDNNLLLMNRAELFHEMNKMSEIILPGLKKLAQKNPGTAGIVFGATVFAGGTTAAGAYATNQMKIDGISREHTASSIRSNIELFKDAQGNLDEAKLQLYRDFLQMKCLENGDNFNGGLLVLKNWLTQDDSLLDKYKTVMDKIDKQMIESAIKSHNKTMAQAEINSAYSPSARASLDT